MVLNFMTVTGSGTKNYD